MTPSFGSNPIFDPDMSSGRNPLSAIWRRRLLFAIVFLLVWGAAIGALIMIPSSYLSTGAVIIVEPERALNTPSAVMTQNVGDPADVESQVYIAGSPKVLKRVLDMPAALASVVAECRSAPGPFKSDDGHCDMFNAESPAAIAYLDSRYSVSGTGRSRVISISYSSPDPATAQIMANALIDSFLANHQGEIAESRSIAVTSLAEQREKLDAEIRRQSAAVQDFRTRNDLLNGARGTMSSERLTAVLEQLTQAEASRSKAAAILSATRQGDLDEVSALPAVLESRVIADIKQQLSAAQEEAQSAASTFGPRHPRLQVVASRADALRASLRQEIAKFAQNAQKQFDAADGVAAALRAQLQAAKAGVANASTAESAIEETIRDLAASQQLYVTLSLQQQRLASDKLASLGRLRLVSAAELPRQRFFPKTAPFIAGGLALAMVLAAAAAIARDHTAYKSPDDGETPGWPGAHPGPDLGPALMVKLPWLALPDTDPIRKAGAAMADAGMREALEDLLDGLLLHRQADRPLAVALLSAFPGEGRTLTTLMLANIAVEAGQRVLIVEADMRSPDIQAAFEPHAMPGLHDILEDRIGPHDAIRRVRDFLDIIPAGRGAANPADLLGGNAVAELIERAADYDLILFDSPPLDRHMDAGLLARQVDGSLFCFAGDNDGFGAVTSVALRLHNLGVNVFGYVTREANAEREMAVAQHRSERSSGMMR